MRVILGVTLAALSQPAGLAKGEPYVFDTVALIGDRVPGTDETFIGLGDPVLNQAGEVAFRGVWRLSDLCFGTGIFTNSGGTLRAVALRGDPAPGTTDAFVDFGDPVLDQAGEVAFRGLFGASNDAGLFEERHGTLHAVALESDRAPGTTAVFTNFGGPVLNPTGDMVLHGYFGDAVIGGVFKHSGGRLTAVALPGDPAPRTADTFSGFGTSRLNNAGDLAFLAYLGDASLNVRGIFKEQGGTLRAVALQGDPAPGTTGAFGGFGDPALNQAGETAFVAVFGAANNAGIFKDRHGTLHEVVREGDLAPGTTEAFVSFGGLVLNRAGDVAFLGSFGADATDRVVVSDRGGILTAAAPVADPTPHTTDMSECLRDPGLDWGDEERLVGLSPASFFDQGLFTDSGGRLTAVALPGDPAPGTTETFSFFDLAYPASLNRRDEVAFTVVLGPPAAPEGQPDASGIGTGVFVFDPVEARLEKILASGDMLEVRPGDVREIAEEVSL